MKSILLGQSPPSMQPSAASWIEERAVVDALFDIGMEHDGIFNPLFASSEEWENGLFKTFPIYAEITQEGALVA